MEAKLPQKNPNETNKTAEKIQTNEVKLILFEYMSKLL